MTLLIPITLITVCCAIMVVCAYRLGQYVAWKRELRRRPHWDDFVKGQFKAQAETPSIYEKEWNEAIGQYVKTTLPPA